MSEEYEDYCARVSALGITPVAFPVWRRGEDRLAWMRRMADLETPLSDDEVEKLMAELRNVNASHKRYWVTLYSWAEDCPHDTAALGLDGVDEHHQRDDDGELFCLLSSVGEECQCGDGCCDRLGELQGAAEDFWQAVGSGVPR